MSVKIWSQITWLIRFLWHICYEFRAVLPRDGESNAKSGCDEVREEQAIHRWVWTSGDHSKRPYIVMRNQMTKQITFCRCARDFTGRKLQNLFIGFFVAIGKYLNTQIWNKTVEFSQHTWQLHYFDRIASLTSYPHAFATRHYLRSNLWKDYNEIRVNSKN